MLIHLTPSVYNPYKDVPVEIISLHIEELDLTLTGNEDLTLRKPYANKCWYVACRKVGNKAMVGIIIDSPVVLEDFTLRVEYKIRGIQHTQVTHYYVYTKDLNIVSDCSLAWTLSQPDRTPSILRNLSPLEITQSRSVDVKKLMQKYHEVKEKGEGSFAESCLLIPSIEFKQLKEARKDRVPPKKDWFVWRVKQ